MKFLVTSGRKKGFAFEVADTEVKIGRRKDNDVMLDEESISGHHARLGVEHGRVYIEDSDSINGTELNGKTIEKEFLKKGDVITLGTTQITVVGEEEEGGEVSESIPVVEKKGRPEASRVTGGIIKKIIAALLVITAIALGGYLYLQKSGSVITTGGGTTFTPFSESVFRLTYEKVEASNQNIFRYEMKIENNSLFLVIDDLKQNRQTRRNKMVDPSLIAGIRDAIQEQQIFSLPPLTEGKSKEAWHSYTLHVVSHGRAQTVQVLNRVLPDNFKRVCATLENFGEMELGMAAGSMSLEELKRRAADAFQRGRKLYDERFVKVDNLFNSIKAYSEVILYLDTVEPKPKMYADAIHGKQVASDELDNQIKDHQFEATRARNSKDWKKARDALSIILQKLPDPSDRRYQDARMILLDIEKRIQSR